MKGLISMSSSSCSSCSWVDIEIVCMKYDFESLHRRRFVNGGTALFLSKQID